MDDEWRLPWKPNASAVAELSFAGSSLLGGAGTLPWSPETAPGTERRPAGASSDPLLSRSALGNNSGSRAISDISAFREEMRLVELQRWREDASWGSAARAKEPEAARPASASPSGRRQSSPPSRAARDASRRSLGAAGSLLDYSQSTAIGSGSWREAAGASGRALNPGPAEAGAPSGLASLRAELKQLHQHLEEKYISEPEEPRGGSLLEASPGSPGRESALSVATMSAAQQTDIKRLAERLEHSRQREAAAEERARRAEAQLQAAQEHCRMLQDEMAAQRKDALEARAGLLRLAVAEGATEELGEADLSYLAAIVGARHEQLRRRGASPSRAAAAKARDAREILAAGMKLWRLQQAQRIASGEASRAPARAGGPRPGQRPLYALPPPRQPAGDDAAGQLLTEMGQALRRLEASVAGACGAEMQ